MTPSATSGSRLPPTAGRHLLRALLILAALALFLLLAFNGILLYVRTPAGTARLLRLGLEGANNAVAGTVGAERATIHGSHVVVLGASLTDPEGKQVAFIEKVEADVVWTALLRGHIEARELRLIRPSLSVVVDEESSNLDRTFAPRHPGPPEAAGGGKPAPLTFIVRHLDIEEGRVDVHTPEGPPFLLQALGLEGAGRYALRSQDFQLEARGNGALDTPTPGPVTIALRGQATGSSFAADFDVRAAGSSLVGDVRRSAAQPLDGHLALDVPPSLARALVRGWPLRVPLNLTAEARREGPGYAVSGRAAAGRARLELQANVHVQTPSSVTLRLDAHHLDIAQLFGRGPDTDFALTLRADGSGDSWATASGNLQLSLPPSRVRGAEVGPVQVAARIQGGRFDVSSLHATLPGVELQGSGKGSARSLEATLHLEVSNLAALRTTFGDVVGALPPLAGHGALRVQLSGAPTHPALEAEGHFPLLDVGPFSARDLEFTLRMPDVLRPLDANAHLAATLLALSGRTLRDVQASFQTEARAVEVRLSAANAVHVQLSGRADGDGRGLLLQTLLLGFPEESWALKAPAAVRFDGKRLETQRLELVSGNQSLAWTGGVSGGHLVATLEVAHLDLAHLPAVVVPASSRLSGILDATASVRGPEAHPDVSLKADLAAGGWHGVQDVSAHLEAQRSGGRLALNGNAVALGNSVRVEAEGPERALTQRIHQPLRVKLQSQDVDVGKTLCQLATAGVLADGCPHGVAQLSGQLGLEATVGGFADGPSVHLTLRASGLSVRGLPPVEGTLSLDADETTPVSVKLLAKALQGSLDVQASVHATTAQLLLRRHSWAGWRTLPVQGTLQASGLQLEPLYKAGVLARDVQGAVDVRAELLGTLEAPRGQAQLDAHALVLSPWPSGEAHLVITAQQTLEARLTLLGSTGQNGQVHLSVGAPLAELLASASPEELAHATLALEGDLGPFELQDLPLEANRLRRDRRLLDGQFRFTFEAHGTLLAPSASATLTASGLGPKDGAHFEGTAHFLSAKGKQTLDVKLVSATGGALDLDAEAELDLSLPALRRGLHPAEAPLKARLHSVHFEPDFVASLLPWMRSVTGKLEIEGLASGTLGRPVLRGSLSWTDGALGVIGFGVYQDIQLQAFATNQRFGIEKLSARVQGGTLSLQLQGTRAAEGYTVSGALSTANLPVIFDDQLWCVATLKAELAGTARPWVLDLSHINLSQVDLQLPEARRKDLQSLSSPPDVVLTRRGIPVDEHQALRALSFDPRRRQKALGAEPIPKDFFLKLSLEAPNHIAVRSKDVTLELALSKPFQVDLGEEVSIQGEVKILRGRGDVWGRRFEVQPGGLVGFSGAPEDAQLDVTGVYTSVQSQAKVYMHFSGAVSNVRITPSSDPPLSESEIYTLLATGRTSLASSSIGSSTAVGGDAGASILGSWAATQLKTAVGVALPIDVLSVEVGTDERVGNQTRLEAGKYLTDDIYIGYQARINADPFLYQNANAIRVEYRFLRRWSLQLEYGDANAGSLDAVWSHDY